MFSSVSKLRKLTSLMLIIKLGKTGSSHGKCRLYFPENFWIGQKIWHLITNKIVKAIFEIKVLKRKHTESVAISKKFHCGISSIKDEKCYARVSGNYTKACTTKFGHVHRQKSLRTPRSSSLKFIKLCDQMYRIKHMYRKKRGNRLSGFLRIESLESLVLNC